MALVVAFENVLAILALPFLFVVILMTFYRFMKTKYLHFLYLAMDWTGLFIWITLTTTSTILVLSGINLPLATSLGWTAYFTLLVFTIFPLLFVDSITRTSIDPVKLLILGLLAGVASIAAFEPGQAAKDITVLTFYASSFLWILRTFAYTLFAFRIYTNSPKKTELYSISVLVGVILIGIIPSFNVFTGLIPAGLGLNELLVLFGIIFLALPYVLHPQLFFLIPYKTSRLAVMNNDGILLFSHRWKSGSMSDDISSILKDSVQQEGVREIHLDKTILVIVKRGNISFILVTEKSSKFLIKTLNTFSEKFIEEFDNILPGSIVKEKDLENASMLISDCFQFLPNYT